MKWKFYWNEKNEKQQKIKLSKQSKLCSKQSTTQTFSKIYREQETKWNKYTKGVLKEDSEIAGKQN